MERKNCVKMSAKGSTRAGGTEMASAATACARSCFLKPAFRPGALRSSYCQALKAAKSAKFRRLAAMASPADAREMNKTPRAGPPPPLRRGPLVALLPLGDARGGADGRQARTVGLVARGPLPARVLRPLRPFARPGAGARVARHGARPRGVARARLARRARRRRGARRHGLRRPGALGGPRRRLVFWGRASGRDDDARDREPTTTPAPVLKKDVTNGGRRGDRVAVKVVHPAARRRVASDLDFLRACARAGEALIPRAKWFNLAVARRRP